MSSKIRVTRIATVQPQSIIRHLGKLGNQQTTQLNQLIGSPDFMVISKTYRFWGMGNREWAMGGEM